MKLPSKKKMKRGMGEVVTQLAVFTTETLQQILLQVDSGKCTLMKTGNAAEVALLSESRDLRMFCSKLSHVSIIARASPRVKQSVVIQANLFIYKSLWLGDGVNNVSAMKAADAAVALLNGYGDESITTDINQDIEDDRRQQKLKKKCIGSKQKSTLGALSSVKVKDELEDA
eukprot:10921344-Ditylum_brightwellii.AAC.1